jgi:hypothetical protein
MAHAVLTDSGRLVRRVVILPPDRREITSMKTLIAAAIRCSLMFLVPTASYAISAQWDLDPSSGDWNTALNWTPDNVPNGPHDVATFGLSHNTDVSISADTEVASIIFTPAATNPYTITLNGTALTLSGAGIRNNSGVAQTFQGGQNSPSPSQMNFTHGASAGNAHLEDVFTVNFSGHSTAGNAVYENEVNDSVSLNFSGQASAGHAFLTPSIVLSTSHSTRRPAAPES